MKNSLDALSGQRNPDFGFKNELIHDLRHELDQPKNWALMYQVISGQENN
jgi:hypothetical protein